MKKAKNKKLVWNKLIISGVFMITTLLSNNTFAQTENTYMRMAKVVVDSTQLDAYQQALKEQMQAALRLEKGVLAYSAVYDKKQPWHITILETYASMVAYQSHIQTSHFLKYKAAVQNMVQALELTDIEPIAIAEKKK